jgi:hypothetical protein
MSETQQPGETEAAFHARMRAQGLRLVQIWVPDTTRPGFAEEARRACLAVNRSAQAAEDQAFIDSISNGLSEKD